MRKFKLTLEYDGSNYHGWQVQPNGLAVQEVVEKAVEIIVQTRTHIMGAGRTDAGVHAKAQVAHFSADTRMSPVEIQKALNSLFPRDIVVAHIEEVSEDFDSRYFAKKKIYRYSILNRDYPSALGWNRCWFIQSPLDWEAMERASACLIGRHDFSSFRGANSDTKTSVRELYRLDLIREGDFIHLEFEGGGFLKYMVRIIVGTLVLVGKGKLAAEEVVKILESCDRQNAGPTAPPQGLCLIKIFYD